MKPKPRILIFSGNYGHLSQALALKELFAKRKKQGWQVKLIAPNGESKLSFFYTFIYHYSPSLFRYPFRAGQLTPIRKLVKKYGRRYSKIVNEALSDFQPNVVFTTHFIYHYPLEKILAKEKRFQFFNLLSDPITLHPVLFSPRAVNLVYDRSGVKLGQKYGVNKNQIVPIGWLIRKQFYRRWPKNQTRKKLGFQPGILTILIHGGSGGANAVLKIIPTLVKAKKPLQIIIVAGKNNALYQIGRSFENIFNSSFAVWESRVKIKTFRFIKKIAPLIQISDLVVGKAGPNSVFETVACEKPFFAITHIHGQEDGNLKLIQKKKLGWVQEDGEKAARLLLKILNKPKLITRLQKNLLKEKKYNQKAEKEILALIKEGLSSFS